MIYVGAILFVGLLVQFLGGTSAEKIFGTLPIAYYATSLFIFMLIGNQNFAAGAFSIWRMDILSKPLSHELFLLGNFLGSLLSNLALSIFLLILSLAISFPSLTMLDLVFLMISLCLSIIASIGVSYFFAGIGLTTIPQGYLYTALTFLLTVFAGVFVPIGTFPLPLQCVCYIIPYTWAVDSFRGILLRTPTLLPIEIEILVLLASGSATLFLGRFYLSMKLKSIRSRKIVVR